MSGYYAYIMNQGDHITGRVEIICENDDDAKRLAKQLVDGRAVELWQQTRKVDRFEPG